MKKINSQPNYTLNIDTPVLQIPEIETKFGIQVYSNSLLILLENINQVRILQQLHFWLTQKHGVVLDGIRWIWKPIREWISESLPDLSSWVLRGAIASLVKKGILIRQQIYKKHHGHNYNPKNRTYYYSIDYGKLQELIRQKLQQLGLDPMSSKNAKIATTRLPKNTTSDLLETTRTDSSKNTTPGFVECHKTRQNQLQYQQTNTYKESSTNVLEETKDESSQSLSSRFSDKNNLSLANEADSEDKSFADEIQDNTLRGTTGEVRSKKLEARSQDEVLASSFSLPTSRKYDPALGIVAPQERKKVQDWTWDWLPDGVWAINGKLDPNFHNWLAQFWIKKYGGDIDDAKANVLINFKRDVRNISIRWDQYRAQVLKKYSNASLRMANGVEISPKEQQQLLAHQRAVTNPLPDGINPVSNCNGHKLINKEGYGSSKPATKLAANPSTSRDVADDATSNFTTSVNDDVHGSNKEGCGSSKPATKLAANPSTSRDVADDVTSNFTTSVNDDVHGSNKEGCGSSKPATKLTANPLTSRDVTDDVTSNFTTSVNDDVHGSNNDALVSGHDGNAPEGAEGAEAYKLYQPEKIDRPVDKQSLFEKLRNLTTKFNFPEVAKRKPETPDLESLSIKRINELIANDPILAKGWLPYLLKNDRVDVVLSDAGELLYVEEPF